MCKYIYMCVCVCVRSVILIPKKVAKVTAHANQQNTHVKNNC